MWENIHHLSGSEARGVMNTVLGLQHPSTVPETNVADLFRHDAPL